MSTSFEAEFLDPFNPAFRLVKVNPSVRHMFLNSTISCANIGTK